MKNVACYSPAILTSDEGSCGTNKLVLSPPFLLPLISVFQLCCSGYRKKNVFQDYFETEDNSALMETTTIIV